MQVQVSVCLSEKSSHKIAAFRCVSLVFAAKIVTISNSSSSKFPCNFYVVNTIAYLRSPLSISTLCVTIDLRWGTRPQAGLEIKMITKSKTMRQRSGPNIVNKTNERFSALRVASLHSLEFEKNDSPTTVLPLLIMGKLDQMLWVTKRSCSQITGLLALK